MNMWGKNNRSFLGEAKTYAKLIKVSLTTYETLVPV